MIFRWLGRIAKVFLMAIILIVLYVFAYAVFLKKTAHTPGIMGLFPLEEQDATETEIAHLPAPEGEKKVSFAWKYQGKQYTLDELLYDSYYRFYAALPVGVTQNGRSERDMRTAGNEMFMTPVAGDRTVAELASKIRSLGKEHRLNEDQIVELVVSYVQTIPYDQGKLDRRNVGLDGPSEKITYSYEVLYQNTGVCQDKSYLAYALLRELGYGVAIFLFPDPKDNHMAVGVQCPISYSNYESGYCFVETTSLGNKIGMIPELIPQSRVATSDIKIEVSEAHQAEHQYQILGNVEISNRTSGKEYTGIVQTVGTQREIERLKNVLYAAKRELKNLSQEVEQQRSDLDKMEKKLKNLERDERYDEYNDLVPKYNKLLGMLKKSITTYNEKVAASNAVVARYNSLIETFYQK